MGKQERESRHRVPKVGQTVTHTPAPGTGKVWGCYEKRTPPRPTTYIRDTRRADKSLRSFDE